MPSTAKRSYISKAMVDVISDITKVNPSVKVVQSYEWKQYLNYPLKAVYPVMDKPALDLSYQRYKAWEKLYNNRVAEQNEFVEQYNKKIDLEIENSPSPEAFKSVANNYLKKYQSMDVWEYNEMAQRENLISFNYRFKLRRAYALKDEHYLVFQMSLRGYGFDLNDFRKNMVTMGKKDPTTIPKLNLNTSDLIRLSHRGGGKMTSKTRNTLRRQIKRLVEAGVFQDKAFRGHSRGVNYFVNPAIMAISDDFDGKTIITDNQMVKMLNDTFCIDINTLTCSIIPNNVKDVDNSTSRIRKKSGPQDPNQPKPVSGFLPDSQPSVGFTCTPSGSNEKNEAGPRENLTAPIPKSKDGGLGTPSLKPEIVSGNISTADTIKTKDTSGGTPSSKTIDHSSLDKEIAADTPESKDNAGSLALENSDFLLKTIQEDYAFACELGNREHVNSQPINPENLVLEVTSGNLNNAEFATVLCQDLFRQFSRLYNHACSEGFPWHTPWHEKYQEWLNGWAFVHKNGYALTKKLAYRNYLRLKFALLSGRHGVLNRVRHGNFELKANTIKWYLNAFNPKPGSFLYWYQRTLEKAPKVDAHINKIIASMKKRGMDAKLYHRDMVRLNRYMKKWEKHRDDIKLFRQVQENLCKEVVRDFPHHFQKFVETRFIKKTA